MKFHWKAIAATLFSASALTLAGCGDGGGVFSTPSADLPAQADLRPRPALNTFGASGAANVTAAVEGFRTVLGDPNNAANAAASGGRREINWDGVPDAATNTSTFPQDFFNVNSTRGVLMSTTGTGFRVNNDQFAAINATYPTQFTPFSSPRLFAAANGTVIDVIFNRAGTTEPGGVLGFGAVFCDVDLAGFTKIEFFDANGDLMGSVNAPVRSDANGHSFAGATANYGRLICRARITLGTAALAPGTADVSSGGSADLVVLDDFLYSEPQLVARRVIKASGQVDVTSAVRAFQQYLGNANNAAGAAAAAGRREVNWDGVPAAATNNAVLPGNFFAVNSTRGLLMTDATNSFRISDQDFNEIDPSYGAQFRFFSANKTFCGNGTNQVDCTFQRAQTATTAAVSGFGAVFSDVDVAGSSSLQFFNGANEGQGTFNAPVRTDPTGLSFIGVHFASNTTTIGKVTVTMGNGALAGGVLDISDGGVLDLVVVDDFLYGEPK